MNRSLFTFLLPTLLFLMGCTTDSQFKNKLINTLNENPEIVFNAIKDNPEKFMQTVKVAANKAQGNLAKTAQLKQQQEIEAAIDSPLKPSIKSDEVIKGNSDSPITIVEYSDFQCPYCKRGKESINTLIKKYPGKIRFVFKHLPLNFHPEAMISAKYFEAIALQSSKKAFKFHDLLFENQAKLKSGEAYLTKLAKSLNLNIKKLKKDITSEKITNKIDRHIAEAKKFGIQGTPGFIINGIPVRGAYPAEYFDQLIKKLIEEDKLVL